jgi:hypothetical protein
VSSFSINFVRVELDSNQRSRSFLRLSE